METTRHVEEGISLDCAAARCLARLSVFDAMGRLGCPDSRRRAVFAPDLPRRIGESGTSGSRSGRSFQQTPIRGQNGYARSVEVTIMRNQCQPFPFAQLRNDLVIKVGIAGGKIVEQIFHVQLCETAFNS